MLPLTDIQCFILDMDGTIYLGSRVLSGAKDFLKLLDERNTPYYFFTNNSSKSPELYIDKLEKLGFGKYNADRVITSGDVTRDYILKTYGAGAKAYVVGTNALKLQFQTSGIDCVESGTPDCVVAGFDTTYNFEKAAIAVDMLREGVPFLATNVDAVCPLDKGKVLPDCASICAMLTHASGAVPKYLGKPFVQTATYIQKITGVPLEKTAIIGDRLYTDMHLAMDNGMCSIGVLSGEMTRKDIEQSDMKPDYVFNCVSGVYDSLK